jgi:Ni,Fe-hydrogenase I small subunit
MKNVFDDGTKNNWCVGGPGGQIADARHPCQGCIEYDFPDGKSPFYEPVQSN